jgi:hypothetical protein
MDPQDAARLWAGVISTAERRATSAGQRPLPNAATRFAGVDSRAVPLPSPFPNQAIEDAAFGKRLELLYGPPGDVDEFSTEFISHPQQVMRQRRLARILELIARSTRESANIKPFTGFAPTGPPDRQRRLARMLGARSADVDDM